MTLFVSIGCVEVDQDVSEEIDGYEIAETLYFFLEFFKGKNPS